MSVFLLNNGINIQYAKVEIKNQKPGLEAVKNLFLVLQKSPVSLIFQFRWKPGCNPLT